MLSADPKHTVLADGVNPVLVFVSQERITKGRVIGAQVEQLVGDMGIVPVTSRVRLGQLFAARLAGEAQNPAGQHDRVTIAGQI